MNEHDFKTSDIKKIPFNNPDLAAIAQHINEQLGGNVILYTKHHKWPRQHCISSALYVIENGSPHHLSGKGNTVDEAFENLLHLIKQKCVTEKLPLYFDKPGKQRRQFLVSCDSNGDLTLCAEQPSAPSIAAMVLRISKGGKNSYYP